MILRALFFLLMFVVSATRTIADPPQILQSSGLTDDQLRNIGIVQKLGETIPTDLVFTDSTGARVNFSQLTARKPTLLALVYYECPNLCTVVLNATVASVADLRRTVGDGYQVVVVSIDPTETPALAAKKKASYLLRYSRGTHEDTEWSFLVGDEKNIHALADAVGYRYHYDPAIHQFAHGSGLVMLSPQGRIVQYFLGIEYPPAELEKAIERAQTGQTAPPSDNFFLLCYCYNPLTGPYGMVIFNTLRAGALLVVLGLAWFIIRQIRREPGRREAP